jgi:beta-glucanase (GH16 family)
MLGLAVIPSFFLSACGAGYSPSLPPITVGQSCANVPSITAASVTWSPQWCQEFNGPAGPPDTAVWSFDLGNNNGWGNSEAEVYCGPPGYPNNPPQCPSTFSIATNTVYVDGSGHLIIQPINTNGTWLSTRLTTQGKQNFQYGLIEASIQIPDTTTQGVWPAFWSLGSDYPATPWPSSGEADFMENWSPQINGGPGPFGNRSTIHTTKTAGAGIGAAYAFPPGLAANTGFHTYGVIWKSDQIEFYVDNPSAPFFVVTPSDLPAGDAWPFNANIFLILNVAVGGTLGGSTVSLANPQPMIVDYVRWYTSPATTTRANPIHGNSAAMMVRAGMNGGRKVLLTPVLLSSRRSRIQ